MRKEAGRSSRWHNAGGVGKWGLAVSRGVMMQGCSKQGCHDARVQ